MKAILLTFAQHLKQLYTQNFQDLSNRFQLSQLEIDILLFLHNNPKHNTARDICTLRGLAKSNVSNAVESLRKQNYLESVPDCKNRRIHRLYLCEGTKSMMKELSSCQRQCFDVIFKGFTLEEKELLKQFILRVDQNMINGLKQEEAVKEKRYDDI